MEFSLSTFGVERTSSSHSTTHNRSQVTSFLPHVPHTPFRLRCPRKGFFRSSFLYDVPPGITAAMFVDAPLYTPQYADFTILAGAGEERFEVHRNIISVHSKFFKIACQNPNFREGSQRLVRLPTVDAKTMENLLTWFYQGPLDLPTDPISDDGYEAVINLLNAGDYLEIDGVAPNIAELTQEYLRNCTFWNSDRELAIADEQKKVDLMCRLYECGCEIDKACLRTYMNSLKKSRNLGLFMNMVRELEDCHEGLFQDVMVALYSTVEEPKKAGKK